MEAMSRMDFRSPLRKLVVFFQTSRDKWKAKCVSAKYELKLLKRRFVNLENNRDQWRHRYQEAEEERLLLVEQRKELQAKVESLSKKGAVIRQLAVASATTSTTTCGDKPR